MESSKLRGGVVWSATVLSATIAGVGVSVELRAWNQEQAEKARQHAVMQRV